MHGTTVCLGPEAELAVRSRDLCLSLTSAIGLFLPFTQEQALWHQRNGSVRKAIRGSNTTIKYTWNDLTGQTIVELASSFENKSV